MIKIANSVFSVRPEPIEGWMKKSVTKDSSRSCFDKALLMYRRAQQERLKSLVNIIFFLNLMAMTIISGYLMIFVTTQSPTKFKGRP